jgi:hypothetical protein
MQVAKYLMDVLFNVYRNVITFVTGNVANIKPVNVENYVVVLKNVKVYV